jgi:ABC-2 type transport system permease protein
MTTPTIVLARRMFHERRRFLLWLSIGGALTVLGTAALYPSLGSQYGKLFEGLPQAVLNLFGAGDLGTPEGYIESELLSFVAPGLVLGIAIAFGSGTLAGSEHVGHLSLVFTGPMSRVRIALASMLTTGMAVAVVTIVIWGALMLGDVVGSLHIGIGRVSAASFMLGLLGLALGALAFGIGAGTGARPLAAGAATAVAVAGYLVYALTPLSDATKPLRYASIWYPFTANHPLVNGVSAAHALVLVALAGLFACGGTAALTRRDVQG